MKKFILGLSTLGTLLCASTQPLHVSLDIYANAAFLNKTFMLEQEGEILTRVPAKTRFETIKYTISDACTVRNSVLSDTKEVKDELNEHYEKLTLQKETLTYEIEALLAKETLLKSLSLKNESDPLKIDKIATYLTSNLSKNAQEMHALKKELLQIDEQLKNSKNQKREYKELKIYYTCTTQNSKLNIRYPQDSIIYTSFYDISAHINNKSVSIEKIANIDYKGSENFENIDFNLYSYALNKNSQPQTFYPDYLGEEKIQRVKAMAYDSVMLNKNSTGLELSHEELDTKSVYKIQGAQLFYAKENLLHVDKEVLDASFKTMIDGYGTSKAYLEATVRTKKDYPSAMAKYSLGVNPLYSNMLQTIKKGKDVTLYFGEDEQVQVDKELIQTLDEKTFFGDTRISTQNWRFKILNTKPYSVDILFVHKTPVSKNADIVVKTLATPNFTSQNAQGKTQWNFTLDSNAGKSIIFGYEISKAN